MAAEERGVTKAFAKVCPCESCKKGRQEPHKIAFGTVHNYNSAPSQGWKPEMTLAEKLAVKAGAPKPFYMGVELETMLAKAADSDSRYSRLREFLRDNAPEPPNIMNYGADMWGDMSPENAGRFAVERRRVQLLRNDMEEQWQLDHPVEEFMSSAEATSLARPRNFWHPKHDGSVTGPEFASRPASLDWWYSRRPSLEVMFTGLLHGGLRSHQGDKAGMHVNISMTAFENAAHLSRFAALINTNKTWARRMSQRTEHSLHWAAIGGSTFSDRDRRDRWARETALYGSGEADRYSALNTPGNGRIEFRLPRGTLRVDRFFKNLEWTHAMVRFTREFGDESSASFMRWVMLHEEYPDLRSFLTERFGVPRQTSAVVTPAPVSSNMSMNAALTPSVLCEWQPREEPLLAPRNQVERTAWLFRRGLCPCDDGCAMSDCDSCSGGTYSIINGRVMYDLDVREDDEFGLDYEYPYDDPTPEPPVEVERPTTPPRRRVSFVGVDESITADYTAMIERTRAYLMANRLGQRTPEGMVVVRNTEAAESR